MASRPDNSDPELPSPQDPTTESSSAPTSTRTLRGHAAAHLHCNLKRIADLPDLGPGDSHNDVGEVQNFLKRYGYLDHDAACQPNKLDDKTVRALSRYKQRHGLKDTEKLDAPARALMSSHRCGLPDLLDPLGFSTIGPWTRRNLTYGFGPLSGQLAAGAVRAAVVNAFNTWQTAGVGLSFVEVALAANPDIRIEWRQAADPDHSMVGGVLAHADFPPGFSIIVNGLPLPLHFDDQEHRWVNGAVVDGYDIETVALHEIGHCLGMLHTSVAGSVMFPSVSSNFTRHALQADDLAGIRALYPHTTIRSQTATRNRDGRLEVFAIGADSALWNIWQTRVSAGPWSGLSSLGGGVKQIAAARNGDGRLEVFAIGMDDALYNIWQTRPSAGPWSGWNRLGGRVKRIGAVANADGRMEVFGIGMDDALYNIWQTQPSAGPWSGWNRLGGGIRALAATINADGRLEVFGIGMDNALWNIWQTRPSAGPWSGWNRLGGGVKQLAPERNADGRLEVFAIGMDNAVWNIWQTRPSAGPWSGWNSLGGGVKQVTASRNADGRLEIFAIGMDDALWNKWQATPSSGPWSGWNQLGGIVKQISTERNQDGRLEIFGIGADDNLWNIWQTRSSAGPWSSWNRLS